jgi:type I restriction enzyme S subunit
MKKQTNISKLRFPEFTESWVTKKLNEVVQRVTAKNRNGNTNVLTISGRHGLINQLKYFNNSVAAKDLSGYYLLERNDFAYNKSYSIGYPMGAIKRLKRYDDGIVSTLYICFRTNDDLDSGYAEQYFEAGIQNREIDKVAQEGARNHGLLNIGVSDFLSIPISLPSLAEQQKISAFLTAIDEKIQQLGKKKALLEQYKKGVMQQIFSQQIRFKDDDGKDYPGWMEKKLGDICVIQSGDSPSKYNLEQVGLYPFLKVEELNNCFKYQFESREYTNDTKSLIPMNSIVFPKRGAAILNNKIRICVTDVYMDSNLMALIAIPSLVNYEFLYYVINFIKLYKIADTSSIPQINNKHIIPYRVQLPSILEQTKIANFLSAIDDKINHVNQQLEQTKLYKKGLLQQMFV